jgi:hypothetical protein
VEYLLSTKDCLSINSQNELSVYDYNSFTKAFAKRNLLMGLGQHKTLDYLSLSLSMPLNYHPHSMHTEKYTKLVLMLLQNKTHLNNFSKKDASQKAVLKIINDCFFLNNSLYKSDFSHFYYEK